MFGAAELILIATIALPIVAIVNIARSNFKEENTKLMWILIVLLLPIVGTILYFVIGRGQKVST